MNTKQHKCTYVKYTNYNECNDLMNPNNIYSPFFSSNNLKVGTIYMYEQNNNVNNYTYQDDINLATNNISKIINPLEESYNNITNDVFNTNSTIIYDNQVGHTNQYCISDEMYYDNSYNMYDNSSSFSYDVDRNDLYDNFQSNTYDMYSNNTFNDSRFY